MPPCRSSRSTRSRGSRAIIPLQAACGRDPPDAPPARILRLRRGAHRPRRLERLAHVADERALPANHRRELRFGGGRSGHEGEPRAPGFGGTVRSPRPAGPRRAAAARASCPIRRRVGAGGRQHHRAWRSRGRPDDRQDPRRLLPPLRSIPARRPGREYRRRRRPRARPSRSTSGSSSPCSPTCARSATSC